MSATTFVALEDARTALSSNANIVAVDWYFGASKTVSKGPQAFMVNRHRDTATRAHFHPVDQYQIFFGQPDTVLAGHKTGRLLLHYTDMDTLYGPFGGGEPFRFLTLRVHGSDFQGHMPEDKARMSHGRSKRQYSEDLSKWFDEPIPTSGGARTEFVIEEKPDRLAAYRMVAPAGVTFPTPSPVNSGGHYLVVLSGELRRGNEILTEYAVGWTGPFDEELVVTAGDDGVRLLVLQYGSQEGKADFATSA